MWSNARAMIVVTGLGLVAASSVSAAPVNGGAIAELGQRTDPVIQIREGCGRGRHRNLGHCRPRMRTWLVPALSTSSLPSKVIARRISSSPFPAPYIAKD
jgi:hypothetical protein